MSTFVPLLQHVVGPLLDLEPPPLLDTAPDLDGQRGAEFENGRLAGRQEREAEIHALQERLEVVGALLDAVASARRQALEQAANDIATLVVEVTQRVLGDAFALHPDVLPSLVLRALDRLPEEDEVWIRVPPASVEPVTAVVPERHRARVRPDPTLSTGCVVETRHVAIEASLQAAIDGISQAATAWVAGRA